MVSCAFVKNNNDPIFFSQIEMNKNLTHFSFVSQNTSGAQQPTHEMLNCSLMISEKPKAELEVIQIYSGERIYSRYQNQT